MKKYFITAIGTGCGKTIVSALLTQSLKADYYKPIQTGISEGFDSDTVKTLVTNPTSIIHPSQYQLIEPASPHIAAQKEDIEISLSDIILPQTSNDCLIIEGAGGVLVPLNFNGQYVIDIAKKFDTEIIVVINHYLGSINHSLLTLNYLQTNHFNIKGLIFNGISHTNDIIQQQSPYPTLCTIPQSENLQSDFYEISQQMEFI